MADNTASIRTYIENTNDNSIGGFTIPLPVTKEALRPWLDAIEAGSFDETAITIREIRVSPPVLEEALGNLLDGDSPISFDELNYLAAKIQGMARWQVETFAAAMDGGIHSEDLSDLINLAENIGCYEVTPAYSERQYGEFLLQMGKDNSGDIFERLEKSKDADERMFAQYILQLEEYVDTKAYGRGVAKEENGLFTRHGYLTERAEFQKVYDGLEDIPKEYRVFSNSPSLLMVENADVPTFLAELHAVAGDYSRDAEYSLGVLTRLRSSEYLLLMDGRDAFLTEAAHAYRRGTTEFNAWMNAAEKPGVQGFAIHLTDVHGHIAGDIVQIDLTQRQLDILHNSIQPVNIEATMKDGESRTYTPDEWEAMSLIEKDRVQDWRRVFADGDYTKVNHHLADLLETDEAGCQAVTAEVLLSHVNAWYMAQAQYPQPDMLRVSQTAAKEMLARGDSAVYRLPSQGTEQLSPTDAIKSGLWSSGQECFAIRHEEGSGLQKWAERSSHEAMGRIAKNRDEQNKSHEQEL